MTVAIYCRVGADDQSCERQERDLRAFARRAGLHVGGVFKETASGARNDRAERQKVMALAQAREIDAILVTELSFIAPRTTVLASCWHLWRAVSGWCGLDCRIHRAEDYRDGY